MQVINYLSILALGRRVLPQGAARVPVVSDTLDIMISINTFEFNKLRCSDIT